MKIPLTIFSIVVALGFNALAQTPRIRFEASSQFIQADENAGTLEIGVIRDGPTNATSKVLYKMEVSDANMDLIKPVEGQLVFAPGERRQVITVTILDNPQPSDGGGGRESLMLSGIEGATWFEYGGLPEFQLQELWREIVVVDNEFPRGDPKLPPIEFRTPIQSALATDRFATVELRRLGDSDQTLTVNVVTADQTARAGVHYVAQSGSITFASLETERTITVPLLAGPISSRELTFELMIGGGELGSAWTNRTVIRLVDGTRLGTVDTSFNAGELNGNVPQVSGFSIVEDVAVLPDGRLYIGGHLERIQGIARDGIARLLPNGRLDSTFREHEPEFWLYGDIHRLFLQSDGRLLTDWSPTQRFMPDGSGDTTFRIAPIVVAGLTNTSTVIAILPGGRLLAVTGDSSIPPFRLNADGSRDPSFNSAVKLGGGGLLVEPDGKIVLTAYFEPERASRIVRLLPDGALDTSFGKVSFDPHPEGGAIFPRASARQPDGRYLVAGGNWGLRGINGQRVGMIVRLNADGTLDPTFAIPANLFLPLEANAGFMASDFIYNLAVQPDGKILVGGQFANPLSTSHGGLVRLHRDGSVDPSFDIGTGAGSRDETGELSPVPPFVKRIVLQPDGQILVAGAFTEFDGFPRGHLVRLNGDSKLLKLSAQRESDNSVQLQLTGPANQRIVLEATSSLSPPIWQPLSTHTITASPLTVTDPDASKFPQRFYRAVSR